MIRLSFARVRVSALFASGSLFAGGLLVSSAACLAPPLRPAGIGPGTPEKLNLTKRRYPLQSADGGNLYAWYLPATEPRAVILQFHDDAQSKTEAFSSLAWLVGRGFGLFTYDYRGYGRSPGRSSPENLQHDALKVLDFARKFAAKNNAKLIVYGQGLGGLVALRAVPYMKSQKNLAALVVEGAYTNYGALARAAYPTRGCVFPFNYLGGLLTRDSYQAPAGGTGPGILKKIPLIVLHGARDRQASWGAARALFDRARAPRFFLTLPAGHDVWRDKASDPYRDQVARLLQTVAAGDDFSEIAEDFEPEDAEY